MIIVQIGANEKKCYFLKFPAEIFGGYYYLSYLCTRFAPKNGAEASEILSSLKDFYKTEK